MKISPLRHPVAVLRQILKLGQKGFGVLVSRSPRTIQAIELGKLKLSEDLAGQIAFQTGVSLYWLLDGDPAVPAYVTGPLQADYTKAHFDHTRAQIEAGKNPNYSALWAPEMERLLGKEGARIQEQAIAANGLLLEEGFDVDFTRIVSSICAAEKVGRFKLIAYRLRQFAKAMGEEFGQLIDAGFARQSIGLFQSCLAQVQVTESLIQSSGSVFYSPNVPKEEWTVGEEDFLDLTYPLENADRCKDEESMRKAIDSVMQRLELKRSLLATIQEAMRPPSPKPPAPRSRKAGEPRRSRGR